MFLELDRLRQDGGTQTRARLSPLIVREYADLLSDPSFDLPKVVAFWDELYYWLADGFHRTSAYRLAGRKEIECQIIQGTQRDAILYSMSANASHGLRRTDEDKENAVKILLSDKEWMKASDRWIAETCKVSPTFVGKIRKAMPVAEVQTRNTRTGGTFTMPPVKQESESLMSIPKSKPSMNMEGLPGDISGDSFPADFDPPPVSFVPIPETPPQAPEPEKPRASTGVFAPLPRNGSIIYDDKLIDQLIGKLMREIDNRGNAIAKSPAYQRCVEAMNSVEEAWQWWRRK